MKEVKLTKKQEIVLKYIKEYTAEHGFPPAVREIAKGVGLNSPSSVHSHIKRLERNGFIKKTNSKFRTLEVVGINEYKTDETKAVKLNVYTGVPVKKQSETFDFPASRIPKNVEIIAYKMNCNLKNIEKDDILIVSKQKSFNKFDELLIIENNQVNTLTVIDKKQLPSEEYIIGKIIELSRKF